MMRVITLAVCLLVSASAFGQPILVGDPNGLVQTTGSLTFDPAEGAATIPAHGWFNIRIVVRTAYDNGDEVDDQAWMPFWSNLDPTATVTPPPEHKIMLATVVTARSWTGRFNAALFGNHLVEFRDQIPLYHQVTAPLTLSAFGYNYQCCLPTGVYEVRVDPDLHMGIPGVLLPGTILDGQPLTPGSPPRPFGSGNLDTLDPAFIATVPQKMGNAPGVHTLAVNWIEQIPPSFVDQWGGAEPTGLQLDAWLNFQLHLNPVAPPAPGVPTYTLHDNPWGITSVARDACPSLDFQAHLVADGAGPPQPGDPPNTLVHGQAHTHVNPTVCPYIETTSGERITIPFALKLYHTPGRIVMVWAEFMGNQGPVRIQNLTVGTVVAPPPVVTPPPPPPPPPPPVSTLQSCTLALTGLSTDGGHTVTVTASPANWVCR